MNALQRIPGKGLLLAFCGLDGSGKTTQSTLLEQRLRADYHVYRTRSVSDRLRSDPMIRSFLLRNSGEESATDLLPELAIAIAADRLALMRTEILPRLAAGRVVILDRYIYGSYAQTLARGLTDVGWIASINRYLPTPHVTFVLDVPPETALARVAARGDMPRWEERDSRLTTATRQALVEQPWGQIGNYHVLDGTAPREVLAWRIDAITRVALAERSDALCRRDGSG